MSVVQRYVFICHQPVAKRLCTVRNAVVAVVAVYAAAVASQLTRNFEDRYEPVSQSVPLAAADVDDDSAAERINVTGCYLVPLLAQYAELHLSTYWWVYICWAIVKKGELTCTRPAQDRARSSQYTKRASAVADGAAQCAKSRVMLYTRIEPPVR